MRRLASIADGGCPTVGGYGPADGSWGVSQPDASENSFGFSAAYHDACDTDNDVGNLLFTIEKYDPTTSSWNWYASSYSDTGSWFHPIPYDVVNYTPASPLGNGEYAWDVTVQDYTEATDTLSSQLGYMPGFLVVTTPYKLTPLAPIDTSGTPQVPNPQPSLSASAAYDDNGSTLFAYHFQIATSDGSSCSFTTGSGGTVIGDFEWYADPTLPVPETWTYSGTTESLHYGSPYCWRADSANYWGESAWSTPELFTVAPKLDFGTDSAWPMWSSGPLAVDEATGNVNLTAPTPSFPTAAGSLGVGITYNSHDATNNGLGAGWTIGPDGIVKLIDHNLISGDGLEEIQLVSSDGSSTYYKRSGSDALVYVPTDGGTSQLTVVPGSGSTPAGYTLIEDDGSVYSFGAPTSGIATPTMAQSYSSGAGVGQMVYTFSSGTLEYVKAMDGSTLIAELTLTWGCTGALLCIEGPDGVTWKYIGDSGGGTTGSLMTVNDQTRDLLKVTYYTVGSGDGPPEYIYNANELASGYSGSDKVTLCYDNPASGCLASTGPHVLTSISQGPITGQVPTTTSAWSFAYTSCEVTACSTDATVHHGSTRLADGFTEITPPCQQSGSTCTGRTGGKYTKVFYDNAGQKMETIDPLGNTTQEQYTPEGQLQWSEDQAGNPTDYSYDPVDQTLTTVTGPDPGSGTRPVSSYNYDETSYGSVSGSTYTPGQPLQGVQAYYYDSTDFLNSNSSTYGGRADAIETDLTGSSSTFAFSWGSLGPPALFTTGTNTNYTVRFVGDITLGASGDPDRLFQFETAGEGGIELVIDGQLVIDDLGATGQNTFDTASNGVLLTPGKHRFVLEYKETTPTSTPPSANIGLKYACIDPTNCTGLPTTLTPVPSSILTPAWDNQTSTVSPMGRVSYTHYDKPWTGLAQYTEVQAPVNGGGGNVPLVTSYSYDSFGRLTGKVLPNGNPSPSFSTTTNATYGNSSSDYGDLTNAGTASSSNYGTTYGYYPDSGSGDNANTPSSIATGCPSASTGVYQSGLLESEQPHGVHATTTIYDDAGRPVSVTKAVGTIVNCYDAEGRLIATQNTTTDTNPTISTYDANGEVLTTSHTAASGDDVAGTITNTYDEAGRLTKTVDANGAQENLTYDEDGNLTQRVADTTTFTSGSHPTTTYTYNDQDQMTSETDPAGSTYHFYYDSRGDLRGTQYPNSTFSWTDANPAGETTDVFNRHGTINGSTTSAPFDINPIADYSYSYNADGQKTSQAVGDLSANYANAVLVDTPAAYWTLGESSGTTASDTTGNGNAATYTSSGISLGGSGPFGSSSAAPVFSGGDVQVNSTLGFAEGDYSIEAWFKSSSATQQVIVTATDPNNTLQPYQQGVLVELESNGTLRYLHREPSGSSGGTNIYTTGAYDDGNWHYVVATKAGSTMSLYVDGSLIGTATDTSTVSYPSDITIGQLGRGRTGRAFTGSIAQVAVYSSALSATRIAAHYAAATTTTTTSYAYDSLGRLEQVQPPSGNCTAYQYDADSNRTGVLNATQSAGTCGSFTTSNTYSYTTGTYTPVDALTATGSGIGAINYYYAGNGTSIGDGEVVSTGNTFGHTNFGWDGYGRILYTNKPSIGNSATCYTYDPAGALLTRITGGGTTCLSPINTINYLLDDMFETNASGAVTTSYQDGPAGDLASFNGLPTTSSTVSYLYYDGHGNQVAQTNSSGTTTATQSYDAWGAPQSTVPTNTTIHAFVGKWNKQYDTRNALTLMGARPYDPSTGRFLSVDPIDGGSLNNYDYVGQDPINDYDLDGRGIPQDETSYGAHRGSASWGGGSLNGYSPAGAEALYLVNEIVDPNVQDSSDTPISGSTDGGSTGSAARVTQISPSYTQIQTVTVVVTPTEAIASFWQTKYQGHPIAYSGGFAADWTVTQCLIFGTGGGVIGDSMNGKEWAALKDFDDTPFGAIVGFGFTYAGCMEG